MQNNNVCPIIPQDPDDIIKMARNIGMDPETLVKTMHALNNMNSEINSTCPLNVTKPPNSILGTRPASVTYGKRKMMGGMGWSDMKEILSSFGPSNAPGEDAARNLTRLVKMTILVIPTYLIVGGYLMNSVGYQTLSAGINAVFNGECTYLSSRIFSAFGMGNPVCDSYNSAMATIYRALNFSGVDMAIIGSSLSLILATPALFNSFVDIITSVIAHSLKRAHTMEIDDETLAALSAKASNALTNWTTLATNNRVRNLIPSQLALVAGISQESVQAYEAAQALAEAQDEPQLTPPPDPGAGAPAKKARKGGAKGKTRKSKRNSRKSKVTKRKTKRLNKKIFRKTKHGRRKKARKTKKYN
jgi:hypothetical protein